MAKVKLSKSSLTQQRSQMALYKRALPSLDLKRRQLTAELEKARVAYRQAEEAYEELAREIGSRLPMLAQDWVDLDGLVRITDCRIGEENMVGVRVPVLEGVDIETCPIPLLSTPPWLDTVIDELKRAIHARLQLDITKKRCEAIAKAQRRTTQRVNLFENVLIPRAQENIKRIRIYLGDAERDAVARSKLAKMRGMAS